MNNHTFPLSALNVFLNQWKHEWIQCTKDVFFEKAFTFTFQQLHSKFNMESKDFFKNTYRLKNRFPTLPSQTPSSSVETILLLDPVRKGLITRIHNWRLSAYIRPPEKDGQEDLWVIITDSQWPKVQKYVNSTSICIRHGISQFKVLHRLHLSKLKLSNMFPLLIHPVTDAQKDRTSCATLLNVPYSGTISARFK